MNISKQSIIMKLLWEAGFTPANIKERELLAEKILDIFSDEWVSVEDRLPIVPPNERCIRVLVKQPNKYKSVAEFYKKQDKFMWDGGFNLRDTPTHWMYLPE